MRVLITGGAGFIGSWVSDIVKNAGYEVLIIDNLSTGKRENIPNGVRFKKADLRDPNLEQLFNDFKPQTVIHLAAQASVSYSVKYALEDLDINLNGGVNVLECARKQEVKHVIFSSTGGAIYGNVSSGKAHESWEPCPQSPYAAAKASFELYLSVYSQLWNIKSTILRYSNIYGPRQDFSGEAGVVAIFCDKLKKMEQPTLFAKSIIGDSGCLRDYLYVKDVANANLRALKRGKSGIYNIGSGKATSTQTIFNILNRISAANITPVYDRPRVGDVKRNVLDNSKAYRELNIYPQTNLNDGLRKTWEFYSGY